MESTLTYSTVKRRLLNRVDTFVPGMKEIQQPGHAAWIVDG